MKIFIWNIFLKHEKETLPAIDFDMIRIDSKNIFVMWAQEDLENQESVRYFLESHFGEIQSSDISLEGEQEIEILTEELEEGTYECVSFEWPQVQFEDILERFSESDEVIAVREGPISHKYLNKIVLVDFLF